MGSNRGRPERVGEILRRSIHDSGWEARIREEEVFTYWEDAVGSRIAAHARPSHIINRRLTVVAESPVWAQQLTFLKTDLVKCISRRFGPEIVTDLYFVTGRIDSPESRPEASPASEAVPVELPPDLETEFAAIADDEIREAVRRLCRASLSRSARI